MASQAQDEMAGDRTAVTIDKSSITKSYKLENRENLNTHYIRVFGDPEVVHNTRVLDLIVERTCREFDHVNNIIDEISEYDGVRATKISDLPTLQYGGEE